MAKQRGVRIPQNAADRNRFAPGKDRLAQVLVGRHYFRKRNLRNAKKSEQFRIPRTPADVKQLRAGSVAEIAHEAFAASQVPNEPRIHGTKANLPLSC